MSEKSRIARAVTPLPSTATPRFASDLALAAASDSDWVAEAVAPLPPIATVQEVCGVLRVTRRHLYTLIETGRLTAVKRPLKGARLKIPRGAVVAYLRSLEAAA